MNLYQINTALMSLIDPETGEIMNDEAFEALQMEQTEKRENIALWIKNLTAEAAALKAEKQAFAERQAAAERKAERLRDYLSRDLAGQTFSSPRVICSFRRSESVKITDIKALPAEYLKQAEPTADKAAIKAAIKAGEQISGAEIETSYNIMIK